MKRNQSFFSLLFVVLLTSEAVAGHIFVLNHPNPQAGAEFGSAIAKVDDIDGDGVPDLLVGAPRQDVAGNVDQGQAYLLSGRTGALLRTFDTQQPEPGAKFGFSVVRGAGTNQVLIGAPGQSNGPCIPFQDTSGCNVGRAFVFDGFTGQLVKELNNPNPDLLRRNGTSFGWSVASFRSPFASYMMVGAPGENVGVYRAGLVAVFDGSDPNPLPGPINTITDPNDPTQTGEPQDSEVGFTFGSVVGVVGDKDGDGVPDIVVGDAQQDVGLNADQGQVHIFSSRDGRLLLTFDSPAPVADVFFGAAVAWDGDQNILVGGPRRDVGNNANQGRAWLISIVDGTVLRTLDLPGPWTNAGAGFGRSVAIGDFDGDGIPDFLVGAPGVSLPGLPGQVVSSSNGLAHVFSGATGGLLATLIHQPTETPASLGFPVAFVDRNGDVRQDPVAAVPLQNVGGITTGQISGVISGGPNQAPIANAGFDRAFEEGTSATLDGSGSTDPDGDRLLFSWTQTAGPAVTFDRTRPMTGFTAPQVDVDTLLTFQLVVTDGLLSSLADTVNVTVINVGPDLTGTITALKRKTQKTQDTLTFTLSICNNGNRASIGDFNVKYYVSVDPILDVSDSLILTKTIPTGTGFSAGTCITDSNSITVTGPTRGQYLIAQIDSESAIAEINEQNNLAARQIP